MGAGGGGFCLVWGFFGWGAVRSMGSCGLDSFSEEDILWFWVEWMMIGIVSRVLSHVHVTSRYASNSDEH